MPHDIVVHPDFAPVVERRLATPQHKMATLISSLIDWWQFRTDEGKMSIDRRMTGGLAWAGLFLVVAIPSADMITSRFGPQGVDSLQASAQLPPASAELPAQTALDPVQTASVRTGGATVIEAAPSALSGTPVVAAPRATPSYLSDEPEPVPAVASLPEAAAVEQVAPQPRPAALAAPVAAVPTGPTVIVHQANRPAAPLDPVTPPVTVVLATPTTLVGTVSPELPVVAPTPMPLSMRPESVSSETALVLPPNASGGPVPPADVLSDQPFLPQALPVVTEEEIVTAEDLEDWESGPLSEFLQNRRGNNQASREFDQNGFFLDEGPNERRRVRPIDRQDDESSFFFIN